MKNKKTGQVNLQGDYEATRGHMGEQAQEIEDRDRQIYKIQQDLAKMRISFAGMQSALDGMMSKVEHTLQLTPTYLTGLQEARGDVDRVARNMDIALRQQADEMRNQMQHLNGQFVHVVGRVREEMLIRHQEMEARMKYELKDQENGITELQGAYHAMRSENRQNFEDIVKYQNPAPPQPVNPVHVSRSHSRNAPDGRIGGATNGTVPSRGDTLSLDGSKN